jgi:hypothetical protein
VGAEGDRQVNTVQSKGLVCMWVPMLKIGLC